MHQFDSDCRSGFDLALPEAKVVALPLKPEAPECVSERVVLLRLRALAFSVSFSVSQALAILVESTLVRLGASTAPLAGGDMVASKELGVPEQCVSVVGKPSKDCTLDGGENVKKLSSDRQLEQFISNLLKYGVFLASTTVLIGGILYLIRYGAEPADYQLFRGESSVFSSPRDLMTAVLSGKCHSIIQLGLLILVATPIARVAFSVLAFLRQRDFTYVILTLFVLSGLIYSLVGAYA